MYVNKWHIVEIRGKCWIIMDIPWVCEKMTYCGSYPPESHTEVPTLVCGKAEATFQKNYILQIFHSTQIRLVFLILVLILTLLSFEVNYHQCVFAQVLCHSGAHWNMKKCNKKRKGINKDFIKHFSDHTAFQTAWGALRCSQQSLAIKTDFTMLVVFWFLRFKLRWRLYCGDMKI